MQDRHHLRLIRRVDLLCLQRAKSTSGGGLASLDSTVFSGGIAFREKARMRPLALSGFLPYSHLSSCPQASGCRALYFVQVSERKVPCLVGCRIWLTPEIYLWTPRPGLTLVSFRQSHDAEIYSIPAMTRRNGLAPTNSIVGCCCVCMGP